MSTVFVSNCFEWIGFHVVNYLLEKGYTVTGNELIQTTLQDHLAMMIGRNDRFLLESDNERVGTFKQAVLLSESTQVEAEQTFFLSDRPYDHKGWVDIQFPLLFGEWMPMNEQGVYVDDTFIAFSSERFKGEAIYIRDFLEALLGWINATELPNQFVIKSRRMTNHATLDRQTVFLRGQKSLSEDVQALRNHYKRFRHLYQANAAD